VISSIGFYYVGHVDGWAAGSVGSMLDTHDGGASFTALASPTTNDLYAVEDL
jgi:hypothetical protein